MAMINSMGEPRTPSYPTMQSPRYGGCVSAFFQLFDWTPAKRLSSTKRLAATKPERTFRKSRSFRSDHGSAGKTRMGYDVHRRGNAAEGADASTRAEVGEDASTRAPGVVARLMGLESLPDGPYQPARHRRSQSFTGGESFPYQMERDDHHGTPILLQDLLKRDFKTNSKKTLRDRIPGFARRAQEQYENRSTKKPGTSVLTAFRCRSEESCVSPAYIEIPEVQSRFLYAVAQKQKDGKQAFHSRLPPPASTQRTVSPSLLPSSKLHTPRESPVTIKPACHFLEGAGKIPELSLQASTGTKFLQGWPLASQHNVPRDIYHENESSYTSQQSSLQESESVGSRPTDSASSKPLISKLVQGRRRGSSWDGSEDSESTIDQAGSAPTRPSHRKPRVGRGALKKSSPSEHRSLQSLSTPRHGNSRSKSASSNVSHYELASGREFKSRRSPVPKAHRIALMENSRASVSQESASTGSQSSNLVASSEFRSVSSKGSKTGRAGRLSPKPAASMKNAQLNLTDGATGVTTKAKVKEDDEQLVGKKATSSRSSSRSAAMAPGKPPPLDGYRALKVRNQKAAQQEKTTMMLGSRVFPTGSPSKPSSLVAEHNLPNGSNLPKSTMGGASILSYGRLFGGRKEEDKPPPAKRKTLSPAEIKTRSRTLDQYQSPPTQKSTEKVGKQATSQDTHQVRQTATANTLSSETKTLVQLAVGDRLNKGNSLEEMATQSSGTRAEVADDGDADEVIPRCKSQSKHSRARSVDDVFPELPLDSTSKALLTTYLCESKNDLQADRQTMAGSSLSRPVERMLFSLAGKSPDFVECSNGTSMSGEISTSPLLDFLRGEYSSGVGKPNSSVSLIDYDELELSRENANGISTSPLIDCDELRQLGAGLPANSSESEVPIEYQIREFVAAGPDDLRWEDEIVETILSGRCCERSCSGPSISSRSVSSDVEDERNGDSWSSCASYNPEDCESPRTFQISERDVEPELQNQNSSPIFVNKILEERDTTAMELVEEAGQPSPVSILNSPFHDEACTTSESSLTESMRQFENVDVEPTHSDTTTLASLCAIETPATSFSNGDKLRQALLDISMFRSHQVCRAQYTERLPTGPKDEQTFVREVLAAARFLSTPGSSPDWFDRDVAIDPSLFDRLESGDVIDGRELSCRTSGGLWRWDRKLLFDCVNEAFGLTLWRNRGQDVWLRELVLTSRPRGQKLVAEVVKRIEEWRKLAAYAIDSLIERDMSVQLGNWKCFGHEVAEVGLHIESMVWKGILEEVVVDIASASKW